MPRSSNELYGFLESLSLPGLTYFQWSIPDMLTLEAFLRKMADDIRVAMKANTDNNVGSGSMVHANACHG